MLPWMILMLLVILFQVRCTSTQTNLAQVYNFQKTKNYRSLAQFSHTHTKNTATIFEMLKKLSTTVSMLIRLIYLLHSGGVRPLAGVWLLHLPGGGVRLRLLLAVDGHQRVRVPGGQVALPQRQELPVARH